jgi:hypothetical protein
MTTGVVMLEPVVSWPREVELGRSYLVTADIRSAASMESWPYAEEQFELSCVLDAQPYLDANVIDDPVLVLHRFGGTYRPVRFVVSARHLPEQDGSTEIWLSYVNRSGVVLHTVPLPLSISSRQDWDTVGPLPERAAGWGSSAGTIQAARATAAVFVDGRRAGSGVLVDRRYLVTAAHVLLRQDPRGLARVAVELVELEFPGRGPGGQAGRAVASRLDLGTASSPLDVAVLARVSDDLEVC